MAEYDHKLTLTKEAYEFDEDFLARAFQVWEARQKKAEADACLKAKVKLVTLEHQKEEKSKSFFSIQSKQASFNYQNEMQGSPRESTLQEANSNHVQAQFSSLNQAQIEVVANELEEYIDKLENFFDISNVSSNGVLPSMSIELMREQSKAMTIRGGKQFEAYPLLMKMEMEEEEEEEVFDEMKEKEGVSTPGAGDPRVAQDHSTKGYEMEPKATPGAPLSRQAYPHSASSSVLIENGTPGAIKPRQAHPSSTSHPALVKNFVSSVQEESQACQTFINDQEDEFTVSIGKDEVNFNVLSSLEQTSESSTCLNLDIIEKDAMDLSSHYMPNDVLLSSLIANGDFDDEDVKDYVSGLDEWKVHPPDKSCDVLGENEKKMDELRIKILPELELTQCPKYSKHVLLDLNSTFLVSVAKDLDIEQKKKLFEVQFNASSSLEHFCEAKSCFEMHALVDFSPKDSDSNVLNVYLDPPWATNLGFSDDVIKDSRGIHDAKSYYSFSKPFKDPGKSSDTHGGDTSSFDVDRSFEDLPDNIKLGENFYATIKFCVMFGLKKLRRASTVLKLKLLCKGHKKGFKYGGGFTFEPP